MRNDAAGDASTVRTATPTTAAVRGAAQQPRWQDPLRLRRARRELTYEPGLVGERAVARFAAQLALVAAGRARVVQMGDCVEDPAECTRPHLRDRVRLLDALAGSVGSTSGLPVLRVGRLAGQLAKPRSESTEVVGGVELPVYRGPMVHGPRPVPADRTADPDRLVHGHRLARGVLRDLAALGRGEDAPDDQVVWTSHEALLLDYETPLIRRTASGARLLSSTHWPWIGERTRQLDGAHVHLLADVVNPVACKIGPATRPEDLTQLCAALDPGREPGRLTLIARVGADAVHTVLRPLVRAVRQAGHPVIWLCDPLHANTIRSPSGRKTRATAVVVREVEGFQDAVLAERGVPGGLHLEATSTHVGECVGEPGEEPPGPYRTLCDPRLNEAQAIDVVAAWRV